VILSTPINPLILNPGSKIENIPFCMSKISTN
jgi:hypothetical protein